MNRTRPIDQISRYLEQYHDECDNCPDEWGVFWDYKCTTEIKGGRIFAPEKVEETSARLISYLFFYGMGRGSTRLQKVYSSRKFTSVLEAMRTKQAEELFKQQFHEVDWAAAPFTAVWKELGNALQNIEVSDSSIMRSKILLAVWGQMPALDQRFRKAFKATWGFWEKKPFPAKVLKEVRGRYDERWHQEIEAAPNEWKHTPGRNRVPDCRLIDIAFWYHGQ